MKTIALTLTFLSLAFINQTFGQALSSQATGVEITVTVPTQATEGQVIFGLYDEATFMRQPLQGEMSDIQDGKAVVTFTNVAPGDYAITLFHDRNGDNQMNFDVNGRPLEDYGVSNNVMSMGPPQWSDAKFTVADKALQLEIRM